MTKKLVASKRCPNCNEIQLYRMEHRFDEEYKLSWLECGNCQVDFCEVHLQRFIRDDISEGCAGCEAEWLATYQACAAFVGHKMVDTGSYAGPDSGAEDLTCSICGYNFHHTYY